MQLRNSGESNALQYYCKKDWEHHNFERFAAVTPISPEGPADSIALIKATKEPQAWVNEPSNQNKGQRASHY